MKGTDWNVCQNLKVYVYFRRMVLLAEKGSAGFSLVRFAGNNSEIPFKLPATPW
jgi:hypothetical protein